jgi:hypothetical protein
MNELWKPIIINNEKTNYEINNYGIVKNINSNKIINPSLKSGYLCLSLTINNNNRKTCKIHRLVAIAFIPNPENKETVNHIDHNKFNNNVDNLEWATTTEQNRHKRKCKKEIQELVSSRAVWRIDKNNNEKLELYQTIKNASKWVFDNNLTKVNYNNKPQNISTKIVAVAQNQRINAFGYKWEYDTSNENIYENEIWKDIPKEIIDGIEGYKISSYGRVKNHKGRITLGSNHSSGYLWVSISPKQYLLHRLVAKTFIPNPENKEQVNHKDGNKTNSKLENLEWNTNIENQNHKINSGLTNIKKIIQYDLNMNKIKVFNSQVEVSKKLNISYSSINKCCRNKVNTIGGFIFKFEE